MYQMSYAETLEDSSEDRRGQERELFSLVVAQLQAAKDAGSSSNEAAQALTSVHRLWSILIDDLGNPENALPAELRADLISIGIWCVKQADLIRSGNSDDFHSLIEINELVRDGLS
ncbi:MULTISPECIES: flagellar biosynthesis regulator FlaF [Pseudovibrio]|uniref:Flagellar protein FlaF n=1 Tax=Pseudovibrio ascidiaceicola TaxID=285279 RepID=A0A1I4B9N9_9HYPH|nr:MULTISPECIES: flagellar biosynthesis regulator FlaF [Pseudovibrio]KZK94845.1 flagellar biosynthesis regulatory protein FlaF [Pseudovibrio sp. W74]KZL08590.1 flagellar biosynthesis regulatory protein FlaF [Pseudovibrio sp. Ad14]KZL11432.1 flagellar biosynthesis regulatory protein FlaF [Pseudovibrio sp. Ad26]SFK65542.1 flagellar protein FlaF [Pseudovibrio ascidiaceicola]